MNYKIKYVLKKRFFILLFFGLLSLTNSVVAQPGALDETFNSSDTGFGYPGLNNTVRTAVAQPDGKIIIGGEFTSFDGVVINRIARLNTDGTLDNSFDAGTGANGTVLTITLQPDGKIVIGGEFTSINELTRNRVARLNSDGSLDDSFDPGEGASNFVYDTAIQTDGKILLAGQFHSFNGIDTGTIVRLNNDGTPDDTFDSGTGANGNIYSISIQPDGKIIIGGSFLAFNEVPRTRIARLNSNGNLDTTFDAEGGTNDAILSLSLQTDGKIILGGRFTTLNGTTRKRIARLNTDGSLDESFAPGTGATGAMFATVNTTSIQTDGGILIGGNFLSFNDTPSRRIARLNPDGTIDESFYIGTGASETVYTSIILPDGKIIIGGECTHYDDMSIFHLARLHPGGIIDFSFNPGTGANESVRATAIQPDGKILVAGSFTSFNGSSRYRIARLHEDGSLDSTFDPGLGANGTIYSLAIQPDGKILIGGSFTNYDGIPNNLIARLNADGTHDDSFAPEGSGVYGSFQVTYVRTISLQPDGKIIIGGKFTSYNGIGRNRLARLNADGTLDLSFDPVGPGIGGSLGLNVYTTTIQSDGKIIIGGQFTTYNGTPSGNIARLHEDGSLDADFNTGNGGANYAVHALAIQPDGKVLIGGSFSEYNGIPIKHIARLNTDGSLDIDNFDLYIGLGITPGPSSLVVSISLQPDGKMIIAGYFTEYTDIPRNRIARIDANGALDESFDPGSAANDIIFTTSIQNDGKIIIGGDFTSYDGTGRNKVARVLVNCAPTTEIDSVTACDSYTWINGVSYTSSVDSVTHTNFDTEGCITTSTLNLTINNSSSDTTNQTSCESYTWPVNDQTFNATGVYTSTTINDEGCTHTEVLNYTNNSTTSSVVESSCEHFTWSLNGQTYTESGAYTAISTNENGCSHIDSLYLTINNHTTNSTALTACDSYAWPVNGATYTSSGEYSDVTTHLDGCTHTEILNLTIDESTVNSTVENVCDSYTWPVNGQTYSESGTYVEVDECHTEELILTVNLGDASVTLDGNTLMANSANADYQWLDCDNGNAPIPDETNQSFSPSSNGNYAVTITQNNCSSTSDCIYVDVTVGIDDQSTDFLVVYPNPGDGMFFIQSSLKGAFSVINALGQTITTFELNGGKTQLINLQHIEPGIYFLTSKNDSKVCAKIVVNQ